MARTSRRQSRPAATLDSARDALEQGHYGRAVTDAQPYLGETGRVGDEAAALTARAHLRLDDPVAALRCLRGRRTWSNAFGQIPNVLTGIAEFRVGEVQAGLRRLERAHAGARDDAERAEAAYYRGWAAYSARDLDLADRWFTLCLDDADDILVARAHALLGYVAESREDYAGSARAFRLALKAMRLARETDVGLVAAIQYNLASFGAELPNARLTDLAAKYLGAVTEGAAKTMVSFEVETITHLGIGEVNAGRIESAFDAFDRAIGYANGTDVPVTNAYLEAADLYRLLGEPTAARRSLKRAAAALRSGAAPEIERQMPFLEAACVAARLDPALANEWLARYAGLPKRDDGRWGLTRDRRVQAFELHARGLVEASIGRRDAGINKLDDAYTLWTRLGYLRRAAYAYADLRALGAAPAPDGWKRFASAAPGHPLLSRAGPESPGDASPPLSPALRAVLDQLCAGLSVRQIAHDSGRSEFTIRNHLKRLFKAFGVGSSAALVAAAMATRARNGGKARRR